MKPNTKIQDVWMLSRSRARWRISCSRHEVWTRGSSAGLHGRHWLTTGQQQGKLLPHQLTCRLLRVCHGHCPDKSYTSMCLVWRTLTVLFVRIGKWCGLPLFSLWVKDDEQKILNMEKSHCFNYNWLQVYHTCQYWKINKSCLTSCSCTICNCVTCSSTYMELSLFSPTFQYFTVECVWKGRQCSQITFIWTPI